MTQQQIDGGKQIRSGTVTTTQLSSSAGITDGQLATSYTKADGTRAFTGDQSMGSHKLTNVTDGSAASDAATFGQMVALLNGLDIKGGARTATDGSETYTIAGGAVTQINGTTIGGVTAAVNDRVLVKNAPSASGVGTADDNNATGTNQASNGIYAVSAVAANITLARATDADASAEVTANLTITVAEGTFADSIWTLITNDPITLNTTTLQFTQTDRGTIAFSGGLTKTGKTVKRDDLTGDVTTTANGNATTIAAAAVTLAKMANLAANSVIANNTGSGATPTALGLTAAATASTAMLRDTNANTKANSLASGVATTATAAGTTTLTVGSAQFQQFTGSTTQTVVLPDATTLVTGQSFIISNQSSGAVQVNANGGGAVRTVAALTTAVITLIAAGSAAGTWDPGTTAAATGLTTSNFVTRETPSGSVNGSNTAFVLANTPTSGTEHVLLNGIEQEPGAGNDYTISGATITYLTAPISGDKIRVSYMK